MRAALLLLTGCSVAVNLPVLGLEEDVESCANGRDDDLDGEMDCADPACSRFCFDGDSRVDPSFEPCFEDVGSGLAWRVTGDNPVRCEPAPERDVTCIEGHRVPGAEGCRPLGNCASEEFPDPPFDFRSLHFVREGSTGTGNEVEPFGTLAEALAEAEDGDVILLAAGSYQADAVSHRVTILGTCASEVYLEVPRFETDVVVENVTFWGRVHFSADATLQGVRTLAAVEVSGHARLTDVSLNAYEGAVALSGDERTTIEITNSTIHASDTGVISTGELVLQNVGVHGSTRVGVVVGGVGVLEGVEIDVDGGTGLAIECSADGPCARLDQVVIRASDETAPTVGIDARRPVVLEHTQIDRMSEAAILVDALPTSGIDTTFQARDLLVTNSRNVGLHIRGRTAATLQRVVIRDNQGPSLIVDPFASAAAVDLVARGVETTTSASCIDADGVLGITRFEVSNCAVCGLDLDADSRVTVSEGLVADSSSGVCFSRDAELDTAAFTRSATYRDNAVNFRREGD